MKKFKDTINKANSNYCKYDFEGTKYIYELTEISENKVSYI